MTASLGLAAAKLALANAEESSGKMPVYEAVSAVAATIAEVPAYQWQVLPLMPTVQVTTVCMHSHGSDHLFVHSEELVVLAAIVEATFIEVEDSVE